MTDYNFSADGMFIDGVPIHGGTQPDTSGSTYFVDGNSGLDSNNGSGWGKAFQTLKKALAISHADIARGSDRWARRNTIYVAADALTEDLVAGAAKTDVIGVGSYNAFVGAALVGNQVMVNAAGGMRWINMNFKGPSGGGDLHTLAGASNEGMKFYNCTFLAASSTAATAGIVSVATRFLEIHDCNFLGSFSDATIELGAGNSSGTIIKSNMIEGDNNGIEINSSASTSPEKGYLIDNIIQTALICIKDSSSKFHIIGNRVITETTDGGSSFANCFTGNVDLALDNKGTATDTNNADWPVLGTAS